VRVRGLQQRLHVRPVRQVEVLDVQRERSNR
jgi:hypothetical protein